MTHAVRRKARAIASLVLNNQQPNPTQSRVCSKCHESKPLANFVSYQSRTIYTVQCSRCRDTSLRAKGRQPPRPPVAEPVAELVWVQIFVSPS
ncbi:hypothetical protein N7492_000962 [Penicillium capsulatum]|uniref:Uncharacterized protein n=1 Tax=Penicillium capsulatum TaxID=69766 RepID=A0A9W9IWV4_9EURO|nr:hypothetical protein N7492_000962 [Penicillium capsulatum]KAJ6129981.1 hypothetical protein N7512_002761 [Penicillium capsulatum]